MTSIFGDVRQAWSALEALIIVVGFGVLILVQLCLLASELHNAMAKLIGRTR